MTYKNFKRGRLVIAAIVVSVLGACATVTKGTHEQVQIYSVPEGAAAVSETLGPEGEPLQCSPTPCKINLPRKEGSRIQVSLAGYAPITFALASSRDTASKALPEGAIIAGAPPGSYVQTGVPRLGQKVTVSMTTAANFLITPLGVGSVVDAASGANRSLSPNPVTVYLAPIKEAE